MNLGKAMREARKNAGFLQTDLVRKLRITEQYISNMENNKREPSLWLIKDFCRITNIPIYVLFLMATDEKDINPEDMELFKEIKRKAIKQQEK